MIEELLPPGVAAVEAFGDVPGEAVFPGEEDLVARAVDGRRREFVTARRCAREALGKLGHPPAAILQGPRREPLWPGGVAGAITHCKGYRAAAVAPLTVLSSIGIDAEPNGPLPDGVQGSITVPGEGEMLAALQAEHPATHWGRLLFSAKESVYKAWYPLARRWLGFEDARLSIDPAGTFRARVLIDGPLSEVQGRFIVARGLVATAVIVP